MNKERILALADLIEKQPHTKLNDASGFNMGNWVHPCGTPACIAGFAAWVESGNAEELPLMDVEDLAIQHLGIDRPTANELFSPDGVEWRSITPAIAASTLRKLHDTGEVDWPEATPEDDDWE